MKKILKLLLLVVLLPIVYVVAVILYGTVSDYKPAETQEISKLENAVGINGSVVYSALIWNMGYAGLGANMDFFYDGGEHVYDTKENNQRNLVQIAAFLERNDSVDFIMLNEVDVKSKRSNEVNHVDMLSSILPSHFPFFAPNYKVKFIPMPFLKPLGKVESGLLSFSKEIPGLTMRHSFPGNYSWPKSIYLLDRCFLVQRFPVGTKQLVIVNTHNSAYDDGTLRKEQMDFFKEFLLNEYNNGNYVVVGGDWNQCPPNFMGDFEGHVFDSVNYMAVEENYPSPDWNFSYDDKVPTNRRVTVPYTKGATPVTLIDYYLTSPNVEVVGVKGFDLDFQNSDHHPVFLQFKLIN